MYIYYIHIIIEVKMFSSINKISQIPNNALSFGKSILPNTHFTNKPVNNFISHERSAKNDFPKTEYNTSDEMELTVRQEAHCAEIEKNPRRNRNHPYFIEALNFYLQGVSTEETRKTLRETLPNFPFHFYRENTFSEGQIFHQNF